MNMIKMTDMIKDVTVVDQIQHCLKIWFDIECSLKQLKVHMKSTAIRRAMSIVGGVESKSRRKKLIIEWEKRRLVSIHNHQKQSFVSISSTSWASMRQTEIFELVAWDKRFIFIT